MAMNRVEVYDLGLTGYQEAWDLQRKVQQRLIGEKLRERELLPGLPLPPRSNDVLFFVEHPHVYTLGKNGNPAHLLRSAAELRRIDAEFVENDRGGDITYHGPGQIVGYPILDLERYFTDIHKYLRYLEETIIRVCGDYGISAGRTEGLTGVWVEGKKICAFGVRCSRWVTMHGFAFNVNTDLSYFGHIVPCGISDRGVTSLEDLVGRRQDPEEAKGRIMKHFADLFGVEFVGGATLPESGHHISYLGPLADAP